MMAISPSPFDRMRRSRGKSRAWMWWLVPALVLIVCVVLLRQPAADLLWRVLAPVVQWRGSFGATELSRLRAELASTSAALADRNALYKENLELKARLGRGDAAEGRIIAGVLQSPPWTPYDTLLIDAGSAHGVAAGQSVSVGGTTLIGRIREVYEYTSRVELFSSPGATHQALLNGATVAVEGQGGGSLRAEVPAGTEVKAGDPVLFPGIGGGLTALISAIEAQAGESFVEIYMRLPADTTNLRFVEILKP